jgi:hydroxymethylglutaryl-CoA lyase
VANSLAAYRAGIRRFDASLGGTGGCITGAPGNQPTERLVEIFHAEGVTTGIDEGKVRALARWTARSLYERIPVN